MALSVSKDRPAPFLDVEPPPWAARALTWMVITVALTAAVAAAFVTVAETVTSRFILLPRGGTDPLRATRSGVVAAVRVHEGQPVRRGEATFAIRAPSVGDRAGELRSLVTQIAGAGESQTNAQSKYESQRQSDGEESRRLSRRVVTVEQKLVNLASARASREAKYQADLAIQQNEIEITIKELEFKRQQAGLGTELADRFERLLKQGGMVSWLDYNTRRLEATKVAVEVQQLERAVETARLRVNQLKADHVTQEIEGKLAVGETESELRDLRASLEKLRHAGTGREAERRETDRRFGEEASKARIRQSVLDQELAQTQGDELTIPAPCDGTVLRLVVKAPGAVVREGEVLAELACAGDKLQAEVTLPSAGVGRVKPQQGVKFMYDAFPYQRYGMRYGVVRWVSPAASSAGDGSVFRAMADIEEDTVLVKGESRPLLAGMGGRADIVVGHRSLLSYAFEPVRQVRETFADRRRR
jgi:biotin carboxyl carrier protein